MPWPVFYHSVKLYMMLKQNDTLFVFTCLFLLISQVHSLREVHHLGELLPIYSGLQRAYTSGTVPDPQQGESACAFRSVQMAL